MTFFIGGSIPNELEFSFEIRFCSKLQQLCRCRYENQNEKKTATAWWYVCPASPNGL